MPAPDRSVKASATGRVVFARASFAPFAGGRDEAGGVVLVEHDLDGDPGTPDDRLVTIYEHVEPLVDIGAIVRQGDLIARSSRIQGEFLHFGVRRAAFDHSSPDVFHTSLPPEGAIGCLPCYGRPLPLPAFPEHWEDPERLLRGPSYWAELLEGGDEGGGAVVETPDGFLVGGWTRPATIEGFHNTDMWLVKLDPDGNIRSQDSYDGSSDEEIGRLLPARDGGYVALARSAGSSGISPLLVKFDAAAETIEWQTRYVASGLDWGNDLRATSDGGYVIAGASDICACGRRVATITKLDSVGGVQWAKSYRSLFFNLPSTEAISIVEASNGDYVVAGTVNPGDLGTLALLVFRVDASGNLIWSSELRANGLNTPGQIEATTDGGFAIVGSRSLGFGSSSSILWFLKLRADGSLERDSFYGPLSVTTGTRLVLLPDGGYVLAGRTFDNGFEHPDPWVLRLDANGQIVEQRAFDGRSAFDTVTGLISTRDGGLILTGGQDRSCSQCSPDRPPANFLVVKMSPDLHVSHGCEKETQALPSTRVSFVAQEPLVDETLPVLASPTDLTKSETLAGAHACNEGAYGPPPVFHSASVLMNERLVACDFTHMLETVFCSLGVPGTEATQPVVLSGSYDHLEIEAHVTDLDSTPDQNDVVDVHAQLARQSLLIVPLVDDGSSQIVLHPQLGLVGEDCFDDPLLGACFCTSASYPIASGDGVTGDAVYSHRDALMSIVQIRLLADCAMKSDHHNPLFFLPGSSLEISLQASDRIGNVSVWPEPIHLTTGLRSQACSGDPCGCCLLVSFDGQTGVSQCAGLEGMPSPTFPCGFCVEALGGSCPP